jgi:glycosyltransferase involved in cell wall biosynthesis
MLIGVDASRAGLAQRTGTENYSLHLIRELLALGSAHWFRLYFNRAPASGLFARADQVRVIPFPRLWTHLRLSWEMLQVPPDLLFVPSHVLPLVTPRLTVVTVHDLGYHYFPRAHTLFQNLYLRWSTRYNARTATRVLADSEATRHDLVRHYGTDPDKVHVVYPGRNEELAPITDPEILAGVRGRYGLRQDYFLYVGTLQPRKNLVRLVRAYAGLLGAPEWGAGALVAPPQLVLAGRKGWLYESILAEVRRLGLTGHVAFTGYVPDADLAPLLSGARAFLFPSLYEGFGFPVLEAMACGTPVACSNVSSLPEVAGNAALQVDPTDVDGLTEAMARLLGDEGLRQTLVERGFRQIQHFSWQRCAREVMQVFEESGHAFA